MSLADEGSACGVFGVAANAGEETLHQALSRLTGWIGCSGQSLMEEGGNPGGLPAFAVQWFGDRSIRMDTCHHNTDPYTDTE